MSLLFTLVYGIAAYLILQMYYVSSDQIKDFCNDDLNLEGKWTLLKRMVEEVEDYVYTVDRELKYAVDTHMCTDFCPCEPGWDYSIYGTQNGLNFADHENNDYNFHGDQTIFTECFAERKTIWLQQDGDREPIDENVVSLIETLEREFECSGLCEPAMFWASKDIKEGPPKRACIYALKDSFDSKMSMIGWSIVVTAFMTLMLLICHCGLYLNKAQKLHKSVTKRKFIFD